jgi:hypothetical protein
MNGLVNQKLARLNLEPISATHRAFKKWQQRNYPFANSTKRCDCNSGSFEVQGKQIVYVVGRKQSEIKNY